MKPLLFATGNNEKFTIAQHLCESADINLIQFRDDSDEIQSENAEDIIRDKASRKFNLANNQPIIVSDDIWEIPALNGFPGAYMKYVDHWFTPEQIIDLMAHIDKRQVFLHQYLAYQDGSVVEIFSNTVPGHVIKHPRGSYGKPAQKVISLDQDNGLSISEVYDQNPVTASQRFANKKTAWHDFITWYKGYIQ